MIKPTLSVCIPAFNEEKNITFLLESVLNQKAKSFILNDITVYTDNSTDLTGKKVKEVSRKYPEVKIVEGKKRRGKYYRVNQAFHENKSNFLVVLDADVALVGSNFLENLVQVLITDSKAVLVAAHNIFVKPKTFIAKVIYTHLVLVDNIRWSFPNYNSALNYYGSCTAYRCSFTKSIKVFDRLTDPHLFIYLKAAEVKGFRYCRSAEVLQWPITTISDLNKFLRRSFGKKDILLEKIFGEKIKNVYNSPFKYKLRGLFKTLIQEPLYIFFAILLICYTRVYLLVLTKKNIDSSATWNIVNSTKQNFNKLNRTKRSIIISTYDDLENPYYNGGGASIVHQIAKRLGQNSNVKVISGVFPNALDKVIDGVTYQRIGSFIFGPKFGQLIFQLSLPFYVFTNKFDLWIESFTPPFSTGFLQFFTKNPIIGLVHMLSGEDMYRKYKIPFFLIETMGLKTYKYFIVLTEYMKNKIAAVNNSAKIEVIPNGIEIKNKPVKKYEKKYVLYIGRIEINQKGLDLLLKSWSLIVHKTEYKLAIVGVGIQSELNNLKKLIDDLNLSEKVVLMGDVRGKKKSIIFNESLFVVLPSRFETFSIVALEAISYRLPIVSFDIEGLGWIPESFCFKVKQFDFQELAKTILMLINKNGIKSGLNREAKVFIKQYAWPKIYRKYENYVNSLLT